MLGFNLSVQNTILFSVVLGSDVIYSEAAVSELVSTLTQLSGRETTIFLAGELRNGAFRLVTFSSDYHLLKMIYYSSSILMQMLFLSTSWMLLWNSSRLDMLIKHNGILIIVVEE